MGKGQRNRDLRNGKNNELINELEEQMAKIDRQFQEQIRKNTKALTDSYRKFNEYVESSFSRTLNSFSQGLNTGNQIRSTVQATTNNQISKQSLFVETMTVTNATFENVVIKHQTDQSGNRTTQGQQSGIVTTPKGTYQDNDGNIRDLKTGYIVEKRRPKEYYQHTGVRDDGKGNGLQGDYKSIEKLMSSNYFDYGASVSGLTGQIAQLVGIRNNRYKTNQDEISKFSKSSTLMFKSAEMMERSVKKFASIAVGRFTDSVDKFDKIYQQNYGAVAAFTGRDQRGYRQLQSQMSSWARENYRGSVNSAELIGDYVKNLQKGYSEQFSIAKAQQDAIIKQANPAINTSSAQFSELQRVLGPNFSSQMAGVLEAVKSTAGSAIVLTDVGDKLLSDLQPIAFNARNERFSQDYADVVTSLEKMVASGQMSKAQMNETINQLSLMQDPVTALKSGNLAAKIAIANPNTDLSSVWSMFSSYADSSSSLMSMLGTGMDRNSMLSRSAGAGAMGFNGAWATQNPEGYMIQTSRAGSLDYYGTKAEQDVANNKFVTELERQNNWWQNSMSADFISKFKEQYPDAYTVLGSTVMPALGKIIDLLGDMWLSSTVDSIVNTGSFFRGSGSSGNALTRGMGKLFGSGGKLFNTAKYASTRAAGSGIFKSAGAGITKAGGLLGGAGLTLAGGLMMYDNSQKYAQTYSDNSAWKAALMGDNSTGSEWDWGNAGSQALSYGTTGAGIGAMIGSVLPGVGTLAGGLVGGLVGGITGVASEGIRALTASAEETRKEAEHSASSWGQLEKALDATNSGVERTTNPFVRFAQEAKNGYSITDQYGKVLTTDGSHRLGLSRVPFDNYRAILHKEESVLTGQATKILRNANPRFWTVQGAQELADNSKLVDAINNQTEILARAYTYDPNSVESQLQAKIAKNQLASKNLSVIGVG